MKEVLIITLCIVIILNALYTLKEDNRRREMYKEMAASMRELGKVDPPYIFKN